MKSERVEFTGPSETPPEIVVIGARLGQSWVFVQNRDRPGWEIPAGHPEAGEDPDAAAARELREETGALEFQLQPLTDYLVHSNSGSRRGRLYLARISKLSPVLRAETCGLHFSQSLPLQLGYPAVQSRLFAYLSACLQA